MAAHAVPLAGVPLAEVPLAGAVRWLGRRAMCGVASGDATNADFQVFRFRTSCADRVVCGLSMAFKNLQVATALP